MHQRLMAMALAGCLNAMLAPATAWAQTSPPPVHWTLQVVQDGQTVDEFTDTTAVGQSRTVSRERTVTHEVGCKDQPAASIKLGRTLTVAPTSVTDGSVTMAIDAHEILEEPGTRTTSSGCALPPQPREVSASHPGLAVPEGQWASWPILEKDPSLVYRVRAAVGGP